MASCEYGQIVGEACGPSMDNPSNVKSVALAKCKKDIKGHLRSFDVRDATWDSEAKLLLARAGVFDVSEEQLKLTICPRHRDKFGIRWRSNKRVCTAPSQWSSHGKSVSGERGISPSHAKLLYHLTQVLLPVGSQICTQCRKKLDETSLNSLSSKLPRDTGEEEISVEIAQRKDAASEVLEHLSGSIYNLTIEDESLSQLECTLGDTVQNLTTENTSLYQHDSQLSSSESSSSSNDAPTSIQAKKRLLLNDFLSSCHAETVGPYKRRWELSSVRTKANHVSKAKTFIVAGLNVIAPGDAGYLWEAVKNSGKVEKELGIGEQKEDQKYLEALAGAYNNASCWETRRQILSIMADQTTLKRIQSYIPGLTEYRFKMARQHSLLYGRGVVVPPARSPRMRVEKRQLDHFLAYITSPHVIQDLPFGHRYLRLSSGKVLETPNVIRTMIPNRLVKQYQAYCEETDFSPFSAATMLRVLSACAATVRKSLQGLDYIAAEGTKAFEDLCVIVKQLKEKDGLDRETAKCWEVALKEGKEYLKADYKVHVSESCPVADHCSSYALSASKISELRSHCSHDHSVRCSKCESISDVLCCIEQYLAKSKLAPEEQEDFSYIHSQAVQAILSWKAHQLRSVRQDAARTVCLSALNESTVLITQDWAMKFLPVKYRETQSDWYAKRGISWHISVIARKKNGMFESQTFVHIVENASQDSSDVVRIIEHTLSSLKKEYPIVTTAFLRQDNAGCYHSSALIAFCTLMKTNTGVEVARVDFSDPQGGKGACDRKAATIKAHVRRYVNEGNDVKCAQDLETAILSHGGVTGVRVAVVDAAVAARDLPQVKLDNISTLNNFEFSSDKVRAWKAFNVGKGQNICKSKLHVPDILKSFRFNCHFSPGDFVCASQETSKKPDVESDETKEVQVKRNEKECASVLFSCPNEGCIKVYQKYSSLEKHLSFGKCRMMPEKETLLDKAKRTYHTLLQDDAGTAKELGTTVAETTGRPIVTEGWALKNPKKSTRFNDAQKKYLEEKFQIGQQTGHKQNPEQVSRDMRFAQKADGSRLFSRDEFLTAQQIQSFFSRMASKLRNAVVTNDSDLRAIEEEQNFCEFRHVILDEVQLQHPIVYDNLNLCEMYKKGRIKTLSIAMLKTVCDYFGVCTDGFHAKRKAEFLSALEKIIKGCRC